MKPIARTILDAAASSGACWCILRKEDEILAGRENDIDLFVTRSDFPRFVLHLLNSFRSSGLKIVRERRMAAGTSYLLATSQGLLETEKVDIVYENTLAFFSVMSSNHLASRIVQGKSYPILALETAAELAFRKEVARRDFRRFLIGLCRDRATPAAFSRLFIGGYVRAFLFNRRSRPGAFVVLVGPDGSGKTSVAESLSQSAKGDFFSVSLHHFSIKTFPRLASLMGRTRNDPDYTRPNSGTNAPIQSRWRALIYTVYYGAELLVYSHMRIKRRLRLGQLVIFDRYLHDWFFQRSYRNVSREAIRWLLANAVKPQLVVYLRGDPVAIHARKPELSVSEIRHQQELIEQDLLPFWQSLGVSIMPLDSTSMSANSIVAAIRTNLTRY